MPDPWFSIYKDLRKDGLMTDDQVARALSLGRITQAEYDILIAIMPGA